MHVIAEMRRSTARVTAGGDFDLANIDDFEKIAYEVLARRPTSLQIDLSNVTFLDSTGLHVLLRLSDACKGMGIEIVIHPSPIIDRLADVTGVALPLPLDGRSVSDSSLLP